MVVFPLSVHSSGRYLIDANGVPFLMHAEWATSGAVQLTESEWIQYLDNRVAKGFTSVMLEAIEHQFSSNTPAWRNKAGDLPFDASNNFDQPNSPYWAHVDWMIDRAAERGILMQVFPAYLGFAATQEGWYDVMITNGNTKLTTYGGFVGSRWANKKNIMYIIGGDRNPVDATGSEAIASAIVSADSTKLFTVHVAPPASVPPGTGFPIWGSETWFNVNTSYTDGVNDVYTTNLTAYNEVTKPYWHIEGVFEDETPNGQFGSPLVLRNQMWWTYTNGGVGHAFGTDLVWPFKTTGIGWQAAMDLIGSVCMMHCGNVVRNRAWWKLVPDTGNTTLTAGQGTSGSGNVNYATCARASDGSFAILYIPMSTTITVDMTRIVGPIRCLWFDPTNGTYQSAAGGSSTVPAVGSRTFTTPGNNAGGDLDWVLILDSVTSGRSPVLAG